MDGSQPIFGVDDSVAMCGKILLQKAHKTAVTQRLANCVVKERPFAIDNGFIKRTTGKLFHGLVDQDGIARALQFFDRFIPPAGLQAAGTAAAP